MSSSNFFCVNIILKFKKSLLKISDKILPTSIFTRFAEAIFSIISESNFVGVWPNIYSYLKILYSLKCFKIIKSITV